MHQIEKLDKPNFSGFTKMKLVDSWPVYQHGSTCTVYLVITSNETVLFVLLSVTVIYLASCYMKQAVTRL